MSIFKSVVIYLVAVGLAVLVALLAVDFVLSTLGAAL